MVKMTELNLFEEIVESKSFNKAGLFFLAGYAREVDVAKKTGVTRQTLAKQLGVLDEYIDQQKWSPNMRGKPLRFDAKILTEYIAIKLGLNSNEIVLLNELVHDVGIQSILIKNNYDFRMAISKVILTIILIKVVKDKGSEIDKVSLTHIIDTFFSEFLIDRSTEQKNILAQTKEDSDNYERAIKTYAKSKSNEFYKTFFILFHKLDSSQLLIATYPSTWYTMLSSTLLPLSKYNASEKGVKK